MDNYLFLLELCFINVFLNIKIDKIDNLCISFSKVFVREKVYEEVLFFDNLISLAKYFLRGKVYLRTDKFHNR